MISVGILAIQGGFSEHETAFKRCVLCKEFSGKDVTLNLVQVRSAEELKQPLDAIVIPGGESTTMARILKKDGFGEHLNAFISRKEREANQPPLVWGTCSGLIMLSNTIQNQKEGGQYHIGGIDVTVSRNFFGRQINSFESTVDLNEAHFKERTCSGVFIRAPAVVSCESDKVEVLGTIMVEEISPEPVIVAVRQNNLLATSFHPELTDDLMWHKHFLNMILDAKGGLLAQ